MSSQLATLDWIVIFVYLAGLIGFSAWLSKRQHSRADYYVAGRNTGAVPIAVSIMATQCSSNSILGAPAFVAFAAGGGLIWLQYELAVPLAMMLVMMFMFPLFYRLRLISVYDYLERRFDLKTRLLLSGLFQFVRAFATAVTVYSIAIVIELITGLSFFWSVVMLGVVTVVYDVLGGVRAVIYSDVIQMTILVGVLVALLAMLVSMAGGWSDMLAVFPAERLETLDFSSHGLGDGEDFAFWPMLFGGLFLYVSYYGCDQSQVQRELCAANQDEGQKALLINGLFRFPLVLLYCFVGVGIGVHAAMDESFLTSLGQSGGATNFNLAVPAFIIQNLPVGVVGIAMVALFAAAMSSLDSVINSLSATTMEDFVRRFHRDDAWSDTRELFFSRMLTVAWGTLTLWMAFYVGDIASTVLVAINKIGSLINGPVLAVFALGLLTKKAKGFGACLGLVAGFVLNLLFWQFVPEVSWLWWNVFGFLTTFIVGLCVSSVSSPQVVESTLVWRRGVLTTIGFNHDWRSAYVGLVAYFFVLLVILLLV